LRAGRPAAQQAQEKQQRGGPSCSSADAFHRRAAGMVRP
jgi:hypothetical protein